jgi:hypothetical protein
MAGGLRNQYSSIAADHVAVFSIRSLSPFPGDEECFISIAYVMPNRLYILEFDF